MFCSTRIPRRLRTRGTAVTLALVLASPVVPGMGHRLAAQASSTGNGPRAVLITGASSGIGRLTTELLAGRGFFVYAGARSDEDMAALNDIPNVQAIRLDVTIQAEIDAAAETVRNAGRGLYAVINNAGVGVLGPTIEFRDDDMRYQFDINVWGPLRVTRAFAPMIIESRGRIATTSSLAGILPYAFSSPYVISKYAVEGFVDNLAVELEEFGVAVAAIVPGAYNSRIGVGMGERLREAGYGGPGSRYEGRFDAWPDAVADRSRLAEPVDVAEAFHEFLTADSPRRRYMVVPGKREAEMAMQALLDRIAELNISPHGYTRDELVRMLDEALARGGS
jgi:NAD(P)-dependent dehydrogenase (short-subunit alcohol dehydrogenase family)